MEEFTAAVLSTKNGGKPLIVDYTKSYCQPKDRMGPIFETYAGKYPDLVLRKVNSDVNVDANPGL